MALGAGYLADAVGRYGRAIICGYRDKHLGKLKNPDDLCVPYAMRALAFWRARETVPEADRGTSLFASACLAGAARDVAFARARTQWKTVDGWLGKDVGAAIGKAAEQFPVLATPADEVLG